MMAAACAGENGYAVTLIEKNDKLGKKIYITGKGRCNVTNACENSEFFSHVVSNPKFLYAALNALDSRALMQRIEENGTPLKVERGNRVFPKSDKASDITKALEQALKKAQVKVRLNTELASLMVDFDEEGKRTVKGVMVKPAQSVGHSGRTKKSDDNQKELAADAVILATGGLSYPSTGSTGDGHSLLKALDIRITDMRPALCDLITKEDYVPMLQGLSLRNVSLRIGGGKKPLFESFGELLFTHRGISGPLALSASSVVAKHLKEPLVACVDLKPAVSVEELDARLLKLIDEQRSKAYKNFFGPLLPQKMIPVFLMLTKKRFSISEEMKCAHISHDMRLFILELLKRFPLTVTGTGDYREAVITQGGVDVKEINPSTMQLKSVAGLYVCGELIDVDAFTGGFNLQCAFSTGYLAGQCKE